MSMISTVAKHRGACCLLLWLATQAARAQFGMAGPDVTYTAVTETGGAHPGATIRAALTFRLSEGWHVNAHKPREDLLIPTELSLAPSPGIAVKQVAYPEHTLYTFSFQPEPLAVYEQTFTIGVVLEVAGDLEPGDRSVEGQLHYQACNDKQCAPPKDLPVALTLTVVPADQPLIPQHEALFQRIPWEKAEEAPALTAGEGAAQPGEAVPAPPEPPADEDWHTLAAHFDVAGRLAGYADTEAFLAFLDATEAGESTSENRFADMALWLVLVLVLAGGLGLNLTPCVLPLIPINIGIIGAGARAGSKSRGFALGLAYGVGIAFVYGALGLVVVLGISSAFGTINATPWFNAAIAVIFVVLGLAMFDVIYIDFSKYQAQYGIRKNERGSFLIAFAMGCISALLAGACVAPVVIYTIVYAQDQYAKGIPIALFLPFLLGLGMALPWPFLGAGLSFLPKPGGWMDRVKQVFGVLILAFALYYGHLAYTLYSDRNVDPAAVQESVAASEEAGWLASLEVGLAQARAEGKPVLLDFWATWCKNCLVMNKTVLKDPGVLERLEGYVKVKYQAEDPSQAPAKDVMEHYAVLGLPTYLVLHPTDVDTPMPTR